MIMSSSGIELDKLSKKKKELLSLMLRKQGKGTVNKQTIMARNIQDYADKAIPCSFSQQRLWFLDQLVPENSFYSIPIAVKLEGVLNVNALEAALNTIIMRHESLRTNFKNIDGEPIQVISENLQITIHPEKLELKEDESSEDAITRIAEEEALLPFDLTTDSLIRVRLLNPNKTIYILLLNLHHIISDGWSSGILVNEIATLYTAYLNGRDNPLPSLPIQYADYAIWQKASLTGDILAKQLDFWKQKLSGTPTALQLPCDYNRPVIQKYNGSAVKFKIADDTAVGLYEITRQYDVTLFMVLMAAFMVLMSRYSNQKDISVGTPIANRTHSEVEKLIGFFVNTLVIRGKLCDSPTFVDFLLQIKDTTLDAYEHQDIPFEQLVEALQPERDLSRTPLFQVMLALHNTPKGKLELPDVLLTPLEIDRGTTKFDMFLSLSEEEQGLFGSLEYSTDLFKVQTINRTIDHFKIILSSIISDPLERVNQLKLLKETERQQILIQWNETDVHFPDCDVIQNQLEKQAKLTPDQTALIYKGQKLSYAELDKRSNQLAHYLRKSGVKEDALVGICLYRSVDMVVSLLGIAKAGGAYLPLDPDYPKHRIQFILDDVHPVLVLTQTKLLSLIDDSHITTKCLDRIEPDLADQIVTPISRNSLPDSLAYVIYTSGSTGKPKGVGVSHKGLINRLHWMQKTLQLNTDDVVLQKTPYGFDVSVWEFFWPLITGATLVLAKPDGHKDPVYLTNLIEQTRVTTLHFVPSMLDVFIAALPSHNCQSIRQVVCSGEALKPEHVKEFHKRMDAKLFNLYGPTEASIDVSHWQCEQSDVNSLSVPIGYAIDNTQLYILDECLEPVPQNVAGELYIAGAGLARGYINRAKLTAEKFIPNPFNNRKGDRIYKTGDMARYQENGAIEYLGRLDHQVKIRGYRIELGEIETLISEHDAVHESIVLASEDIKGDKRLVAYIVAEQLGNVDDIKSDVLNEHSQQQVTQWQQVYEQTYVERAVGTKATRNFISWNSSYNEIAIPLNEMNEWLDTTVTRILSKDPGDVLEIGCGTGLILFQVAPHSTSYHASDFSQQALNYIESNLTELDLDIDSIKFTQAMADDIQLFDNKHYDTIILNSVIQYFPDSQYFNKVIKQAVKNVIAGGRIFIGDIRHYGLLPAFHSSVECFKEGDNECCLDLFQKVQKQLFYENELLIDPRYFQLLRDEIPEISHIEILPKQHKSINELSCYRYDVILYINTNQMPEPEFDWFDWQQDQIDIDKLVHYLERNKPDILGLAKISNSRTEKDSLLWEALKTDKNRYQKLKELQDEISQINKFMLDPNIFWSLAETQPYEIEIDWSQGYSKGEFDVILKRKDGPWAAVDFDLSKIKRPFGQDNLGSDLARFANRPMQGKTARELVPLLKQSLGEQLPDYMVPSLFIFLETLPLTPNGKVDRKALPELSQIDDGTQKAYIAPQTSTEKKLAEIWMELLRLDKVGIEDNFFEVGGHSLLATQLISQVRQHFELELPLRNVFEHPTLEDFSRLVKNSGKGDTAVLLPAITCEDRTQPIPLSFAQQRLWFINQLEPISSAYNIPAVVKLDGMLNVGHLEHALNVVVQRHEILRTVFKQDNQNNPTQLIYPELKINLPIIGAMNIEDAILAAEKEAQGVFNLQEGPLIRGCLFRIDDERHILVLTLHHIISDGWSTGLLVNEIVTLYHASASNQASTLLPLPVQYSDYSIWQHQWLEGDVLQNQLNYWKNKLSGAPSSINLPIDYNRPKIQSTAGKLYHFKFPENITAKLNKLGNNEDATLFMVLLSAFMILIHRYSNQHDICIGSPIANRTRGELEKLIGFFVNTLVLRGDLSNDMSFSDFLSQIKTTTLEAYGNQDISFERLVEELQPERSLNNSPLFQVMFSLQNAPMEDVSIFSTLEMSPVNVDLKTSNFDLSIDLTERAGELYGVVEYCTDLFKESTIARMIKHFEILLINITDRPEHKLSTFNILTTSEKTLLINEFKGESLTFPDLCLHKRFECQVNETPNAIAIVDGKDRLSYEQLNIQANRLANFLITKGIREKSLIGLCAERSIEMLIGVLGVLKMGGVYVPMDAMYPPQRIAHMINDSQCTVLLTQFDLLDKIPKQNEIQIICLDKDWDLIMQHDNTNPNVTILPSDNAYMIYTSGSTGKPKGALIHHAGAMNHIYGEYKTLDISEKFNFLQTAPASSDISVWQFLGPLLCGGKTVIQHDVTDVSQLIKQIEVEKIILIELVPVIIQLLLDHIRALPESKFLFSSLRLLMTTGEAVSIKLVNEWLTLFPDIFVVNAYGPTEASDDITQRIIKSPITGSQQHVSIGKPLPNLSVHIVNKYLQLQPVGVAGEICVSGIGVGNGYWNNEEKTKLSFVNNPYTESYGDVIYKTGDIGRWLSDGNIEFIGRIDNQVKIRGFRIELGEVEASMMKHQQLKEVVVTVCEDKSAIKRLVAYVVAYDNKTLTLTSAELLDFAKTKLPDYMVPNTFVMLEKMPLTPNGKIDRKALPAPDMTTLSNQEYVAPRNEMESLLASIWSDVLGIERIGVNDNFFELGGHSLLATQVASRLRKHYVNDISLRLFFEYPNIAAFVEILDLSASDNDLVSDDKIKLISRDQPIPLSYAQQRLWFLDQLEQNNAFYNMPSAIKLAGDLNINALNKSINEVIRRHEVLRTVFKQQSGQAYQVVLPKLELLLDTVDIETIADYKIRQEQLQLIIEQDATRPFDLESGPLIRSLLIRMQEHEHVLLLTTHHIVADGWSTGILVNEIAELYNAYVQRHTSQLTDLPVQYADYSVWQRSWLFGERLEKQKSYWKNQLITSSHVLNLPTDFPRPAVQTYQGDMECFEFSKQLTDEINETSKRYEVTPFMLLIAVFMVLIQRYSGQYDINVGTPIANRSRAELEQLIGFFVNTLVLRGDATDNPDFDEFLTQIKETTLAAYEHQDIPFEKLVEELQPERDLSRSPLFQVMFVLQNAPLNKLELSGLDIELLDSMTGTTKFDITASLTEWQGVISGAFEYNCKLFKASTIRQMISHYEKLLLEIVKDCKRPISELPLLNAEENYKLLNDWNDTAVAYDFDSSIHELFEHQADKTPDSIAIIYENQNITYQVLNKKANQLACHLREHGVVGGSLVGLCMQRSSDLLISLLAILKSGAAYVPMDIKYPEERLQYMLRNANVSHLLTQRSILTENFIDRHIDDISDHLQVIYIDDDMDTLEKYSDENLNIPTVKDDLVYVTYTSGSTGKPKGIAMEQHSLLNLIHWQLKKSINCPTTLQFASISFDVSFQEIFSTWLSGGSLVVVTEIQHSDISCLSNIIQDNSIQRLFLPVAVLLFLEKTNAELLKSNASVKEIIVAGEQLQITPALRDFFMNTDCSLINQYGPAESHVVTAYRLGSDPQSWCDLPAIGKPIDNTSIYILDKNLSPVPIGVVGEIYIAGEGVSRGYINQHELTSDKFIRNIFCNSINSSMYKTGDLGRYCEGGIIEYIGRVDYQVKLRGYRIEPSEIEVVLNSYQGIQDSVVVCRESTPGEKYLAAYVVSDTEILDKELRQYLKEKLPEYMLPATITWLSEMPLNNNGKINKSMLPVIDVQQQMKRIYVAPDNKIETALVKIFEQVLEVDKVGVNDNFFDIGGHSLLATQVAARVRDYWGIDFELRVLFEETTVRQLSQYIRAVVWARDKVNSHNNLNDEREEVEI